MRKRIWIWGVTVIKEVIVVEGKDDIVAVKAAVEAEVIATGGFGYKRELVRVLENVAKRRGIIVLTDPDYAGEQIRKDISKNIKNCKHAFLPQNNAIREGDIGVENASPEDIRIAISKARPLKMERVEKFTQRELLELGFIGGKDSKVRREKLGSILGIGYSNSKQLLNRLNNFGIKREEFENAVERIDGIDGK